MNDDLSPDVRGFFTSDFGWYRAIDFALAWSQADGAANEWIARINYDDTTGVGFMSYFYSGPSARSLTPRPEATPSSLLETIAHLGVKDGVGKILAEQSARNVGLFSEGLDELTWSRRAFVYLDADLTVHERAAMVRNSSTCRLFVRDRNMLRERWHSQRAAAFLIHDSRDKDSFVVPLARELQRKYQLKVWYDGWSMKPGVLLADEIERGLRECSHAVLIVSKNALSNAGWVQREVALAKSVPSAVLLPVLADVEPQDAGELAAERLCVKWSSVEDVARQLALRLGWLGRISGE